MQATEMKAIPWESRVPQPRSDSLARVAVVADQSLTGQAVQAALLARGFASTNFAMPRQMSAVRDLRQRFSRRRIEVALMLHELLDWTPTAEAMRTIREISEVPWVFLSESEDDARWGAALDAGAVGAFSISVGLEQVVGIIQELREGREVTEPVERDRLLETWEQRGVEHRYLSERLDRLSAREREVLAEMARGRTVTEIAQAWFVSVGTVRSQVRSVLTKLEVQSQLAAVAVWQRAHEILPPARRI